MVRVYSRPDGSIAYDSLLDPATLGLPMLQYTAPDGSTNEYPPFITGYAIARDGSEAVAGICTRGTCSPDGLSSWSPDSQTVLFRSTDGGVRWTEIGRLDVGATVFGLLPSGEVLLTMYDSRESTVSRVYPDLKELQVPPGTNYWRPEILANGDLIWRDYGGVAIRSDGRPLVSVPQGVKAWIDDFVVSSDGTQGIALTGGSSSDGSHTYYVMPFDGDGAIGRGEFAAGGDGVVWSGGPERLSAYLSDQRVLLGNTNVSTSEIAPNGNPYGSHFVPVSIDLEAGTIRALAPFLNGVVPRSRNVIAAVQQGPFARVVNTDGDCLNIRAEPGAGPGP